MNITFKQLRVFVAIARSGTLTQAASQLFMTKGALSQTLSELENQLGVRLFERQHARLLLNHEGQRLLPVADELLTRMQGVESLFNNGNGDTRLMVGCTKTIGSYLLPELLSAFQLRYGWLPCRSSPIPRALPAWWPDLSWMWRCWRDRSPTRR
ncbi:LysR family transcriptional regulator [Edwardsiella piscicida]|nr:LysR family transcriptional regulator [Edwardsiella piscicida]